MLWLVNKRNTVIFDGIQIENFCKIKFEKYGSVDLTISMKSTQGKECCFYVSFCFTIYIDVFFFLCRK